MKRRKEWFVFFFFSSLFYGSVYIMQNEMKQKDATSPNLSNNSLNKTNARLCSSVNRRKVFYGDDITNEFQHSSNNTKQKRGRKRGEREKTI